MVETVHELRKPAGVCTQLSLLLVSKSDRD